MNTTEFDVSARHELGISAIPSQDTIGELEVKEMLSWSKVIATGHIPSAREGHSCVSHEHDLYIFGGMESNKRTNTLYRLNMKSMSWSIISTTGVTPCARHHHASCIYKNIMVIHGGEGQDNQSLYTNHSTRDFGMNGAGICPGDSISSKLRPSKKIEVVKHDEKVKTKSRNYNSFKENSDVVVIETPPSLIYLEDFQAYDIYKQEWKSLPSVLAPLPRKGHTITLAPIHDHPHFILFGGYSKVTDIYSNSIHVCNADDVTEVYKTLISPLKHPPSPGGTIAALSRSNVFSHPMSNDAVIQGDFDETKNLPVVTWRTLVVNGKTPSGRYLHSCTHVHGASGENFLAVFGGVGKGDVLLSDLHLLNLDTLTWTEPHYNSIVIQQQLAGEAPPGVFGHTSFAPVSESKGFKSKLLVFGGATNRHTTSGTLNNIYCFDLVTQLWSKIQTGHVFPSQRYGHAAAIIENFAIAHTVPSKDAMGSNSALLTGQSIDINNRSCAIIFGGRNETSALHDAWALDLHWRPQGIEQFDGNEREKFQSTYNSIYPQSYSKLDSHSGLLSPHKKVGTVSNSTRRFSKFKNFKGLQSLSPTNTLGSFSQSNVLPAEFSNREAFASDEALTHDLLVAKRERAHADMQFKNERDKVLFYESAIKSMESELAKLKEKVSLLEKSHEEERVYFQQELEAGRKREEKLKEINEEAFELLTLHGFERFEKK